MVLHECISGDRNSLSEFASNGCMAKAVEAIRFGSICDYDTNSYVDERKLIDGYK